MAVARSTGARAAAPASSRCAFPDVEEKRKSHRHLLKELVRCVCVCADNELYFLGAAMLMEEISQEQASVCSQLFYLRFLRLSGSIKFS